MRPRKAFARAEQQSRTIHPHFRRLSVRRLNRTAEKAALRQENRAQAERIEELEAQVRALDEFSAMAANELLKPLILAEGDG